MACIIHKKIILLSYKLVLSHAFEDTIYHDFYLSITFARIKFIAFLSTSRSHFTLLRDPPSSFVKAMTFIYEYNITFTFIILEKMVISRTSLIFNDIIKLFMYYDIYTNNE